MEQIIKSSYQVYNWYQSVVLKYHVSLRSECDVDVGKIHTIVMEVMDTRVHLHLDHVKLDVFHELGEVRDGFLGVVSLKAIVDHLDLRLCRVLAISSRASKALVDGVKLGNTIFNVCVVALHDGISRFMESLQKLVLVLEASCEVVGILSLGEGLDCATNVASDFFARVWISIGKMLPEDVALFFLLNREKALSESFACSRVFTLKPQLSSCCPALPGIHAEFHRCNFLHAVKFSRKVFSSPNRCIKFKVINKAVNDSVCTAPEHFHVFTVYKFFNGEVLLAIDDIIAHNELLQIDKALRLQERITSGIEEFDVMQVGAMF